MIVWSVRRNPSIRGSPPPEQPIEAAQGRACHEARSYVRPQQLRSAPQHSASDFERMGSVKAAREQGLMRSEGKEYVVQDGDILIFRFNV